MALVLPLAAPALAAPPDMPVKMPSPLVLVDDQTVSIGVVSARLEDEGVRAMLKTAWSELQQAGPASNNIFSLVLGFLSQTTQENLLFKLLPMQGVRVVYVDPAGVSSSAFMVTMEGYQGFQSTLVWPRFLADPRGQLYPTKTIKNHTYIIRPKPGQDAERASAIIRLDGTYYAFPDTMRGERVLAGDLKPSAEVQEMLSSIDQHQDTYGVMINRHRSLEAFFEWINASDFQNVQKGVGAEKLTHCLDHVEALAWQGDLISDDQMNMEIRFRCDTEKQAQELTDVLEQTRKVLKDVGRAGELQMTTVDRDVLLRVQLVGYRAMLINYIRNGKS